MEFKEGDRVRVLRFNGREVYFYGTLKHVGKYTASLFDCTIKKYEGMAVVLPSDNDFGKDKDDYYVLAEDEEDTEAPVVQHTEPLDKGEIIAQSIIDNRDGSSFLSNHEMIIWLNEIEEMHGENISVKGWNLIFDCVKTSIAPVCFVKE